MSACATARRGARLDYKHTSEPQSNPTSSKNTDMNSTNMNKLQLERMCEGSNSCQKKAPRHPTCRHAAHGTALETAKVMRCEKISTAGTACTGIPWDFYNVSRGYCDNCIIQGELLAQKHGLDRGLYCRQMGVSYVELRNANPGQLL